MPSSQPADGAGDAAGLAGDLLAEEARRLASAGPKAATVLPDDLLPGVGGSTLSLGDALRAGGVLTVAVLGFTRLVDAFDNVALSVLAPDIQDSLGVSDAVLGAIGGAFGVMFLLGSIPMSTLADRYPRRRIAAASMSLWAVLVFLTGQVQNAFWLFMARLGTGVSQAYALPVNAPLLMDRYPIAARTRVFALYSSFELAGRVGAPLFAGGIAGLVGGDEGWRWVFMCSALLGYRRCSGCWRSTSPGGAATRCTRCSAGSCRRTAAATAATPTAASCRSRWASRSSGSARSRPSTSSWSGWPRWASRCSASRCS